MFVLGLPSLKLTADCLPLKIGVACLPQKEWIIHQEQICENITTRWALLYTNEVISTLLIGVVITCIAGFWARLLPKEGNTINSWPSSWEMCTSKPISQNSRTMPWAICYKWRVPLGALFLLEKKNVRPSKLIFQLLLPGHLYRYPSLKPETKSPTSGNWWLEDDFLSKCRCFFRCFCR